MQHSSARNRGLLFSVGAMTLSLAAGLACPGNLDPALIQQMGGGGSGGGAAGTGGGPVACDAPMIMLKKCADSIICHKPNNTSAGGLDLSTNQAANLLGVASSGDTNKGALCAAGMIYLNPGSKPATGYFIDKLNGAVCPDQGGNQMPYLTVWTAEENQCVIDWATSVTAP